MHDSLLLDKTYQAVYALCEHNSIRVVTEVNIIVSICWGI